MVTATQAKTKTSQKLTDKEKAIKEMMAAGVHFGHKKSKWNPNMGPYVFGVRNNVHIIDLNRTYEKLQEAAEFLKEAAAAGKSIVMVGTQPQAASLVEKVAKNTGVYYVVNRWIGGTLTNFKEIKKRLDYFRDLEEKRSGGELAKYTKKERLEFDKELERLERKWGGLKELKQLPDVLVIVDIDHDYLAAKEAREAGIQVVALTDTNTDPTLADYPIPANDDAISSLKYILGKIEQAILEGKGQ